ncbi:MAG: Integral rane protein TerC [Betaproteobacteria bacterium]|nr:Integral rane protein TerC [Betaproteobacteria bacterium]
MIEYLSNPAFWVGLGQIIIVNIVLSGDNAVVIALAARSLPAHQQKQAIIWGSVAAIVMRVILTIVAVEMLKFPYLKLVGALLLFWIAIQLLVPEEGDEDGIKSSGNLWAAIRTILIADLVMSLDNVIGVAAAAKGDNILLMLGLAISIPLIIFGSTIILKLMDRYPVIITGGAALLGWVAGEMLITDPALKDWIDVNMSWMHIHLPVVGDLSWAQIAGAAFVILIGKIMTARAGHSKTEITPAGGAAATGEGRNLKVLVPVDGSSNCLRAVELAIRQAALFKEPLDIKLLNVQRPFPGTVRGVHGQAEQLHQEEGMKALTAARAMLDQAGLKYSYHVGVGETAEYVASFAKEEQVNEVLMCTRGMSAAANMLMGSVASRVLQLIEVPLVLVK